MLKDPKNNKKSEENKLYINRKNNNKNNQIIINKSTEFKKEYFKNEKGNNNDTPLKIPFNKIELKKNINNNENNNENNFYNENNNKYNLLKSKNYYEATKENIFPEQKLKLKIPLERNKNEIKDNTNCNYINYINYNNINENQEKNEERLRNIDLNILNKSRSNSTTNSNIIKSKPTSEWRKGDNDNLNYEIERPCIKIVDNIQPQNNSFFEQNYSSDINITPKYNNNFNSLNKGNNYYNNNNGNCKIKNLLK
jgi:hypothetical protein